MTISTQKPFSALNTSAELAPTQANFPALQHFFKIDETSGSTITDAINGVVITPTSAPTFSDGKADDITTGAADALTSGTWAAAGSKSVVIMIMGTRAATHDLLIGTAASDTSYRTRNATASAFIGGSGTLANASNFAGTGTAEILTLSLDPVSTTNGLNIATSSSTAHTSVASGGNGTTVGTLSAPDAKITFTGYTDVYGIAIFHFTNHPSDIKQAALWMRNEWANGNKVIYPAWQDYS